MELILDNQTVELSEDESTVVQHVVERVSNQLKDKKRVISEIYLDDQVMAGWDDPQLVTRTVGQCSKLQLVSEEPSELAHKVLYEIAKYMPRIQEALVETSALIQSRKEADGLQLLQQASTTWAELYQGLQNSITLTGIDCATIQIKDKTFQTVNDEIQDYLGQVSDLVEEQQYLELSDVLEYELASRLPQVEEGIYQIIKQIEKKKH